MDETNDSFRKYFSINRLFMIYTGSWPYQSDISAKIAQICFCLQHISIVLPEIIKLCKSTHDVDLVIESVPPIFYNLIIAIMFGSLVIHKRETKHIFEKIHRDWESLNDGKEKQILSNYAEVGIIMSWVYIVSCYSTILMFCAFPMTPIVLDYITPLNESRPKVPLYRTEFFVDENEYYYPILFHNVVTTFIGISALINLDIYLANTTQHICGMLAILGKRLENTLKERIVDKLDDNLFHETLSCVKMHTNILDLLQIMNDTLRISFGFLLIILMVMLSFTSLVVLVKWGEWTEVIRFGLFTTAELFHIFCYSYHSQNLINHHAQFYNSIQCSGWYQSSIRTRKLTTMMLMRCKKPFLILYMNFPMSMETFTFTIKTSFSYFTAVKSTR